MNKAIERANRIYDSLNLTQQEILLAAYHNGLENMLRNNHDKYYDDYCKVMEYDLIWFATVTEYGALVLELLGLV